MNYLQAKIALYPELATAWTAEQLLDEFKSRCKSEPEFTKKLFIYVRKLRDSRPEIFDDFTDARYKFLRKQGIRYEQIYAK